MFTETTLSNFVTDLNCSYNISHWQRQNITETEKNYQVENGCQLSGVYHWDRESHPSHRRVGTGPTSNFDQLKIGTDFSVVQITNQETLHYRSLEGSDAIAQSLEHWACLPHGAGSNPAHASNIFLQLMFSFISLP